MEASIDIRRTTTHIPNEEVAKRVTEMIGSLAEQLQLSTQWDAQSSSVLFEAQTGLAKGTKGHLQIGPGWINLVVRLSMILQVQKAAVEKEINEVLDEALR